VIPGSDLLRFRALAFALAALTLIAGVCILVSVLGQPPTSDESVKRILSATLGLNHGELCAAKSNSVAGGSATSGAQPPNGDLIDALAQARGAVERSPIDPGSWLVIAADDARLGRSREAQGALKLSYFTGADETDLIAPRLLLATRTGAASDPDLQVLMSGDLRQIVLRQSDLTDAIKLAYRCALPDGKQFMNKALSALDPSLLLKLQAGGAALDRR